jgi:hypothetical protein
MRVGVAYIVIGWLLVQVAEFAFENFGAPEWVLKTFTVVVLLGLPLALFFAWAFELTLPGPSNLHPKASNAKRTSIVHNRSPRSQAVRWISSSSARSLWRLVILFGSARLWSPRSTLLRRRISQMSGRLRPAPPTLDCRLAVRQYVLG